jgi:hypothetical protein
MSDTSAADAEYGLILLKCYGCKTPTLFKLEICHGADREYTANTHCAACEQENQYRRLRRRTLEPTLVKNQRIDSPTSDCHEANP